MIDTYSFLPSSEEGQTVSRDRLYGHGCPFGFVTEQNRKTEDALRFPELTGAFDVPYWYENTCLTHIRQDENGCYVEEEEIPLCFQADVEKQGNFLVRVTLINPAPVPIRFLLFTGRRRLAAMQILSACSRITLSLQVNVTDIIPRGLQERKKAASITITLLSAGIRLAAVTLEESNVPTLFIAGDSTVTDQSGDYPYRPEQCYCGWGQMLPLFLSPSIALSNHAHSGLTTESFREEGHHAIVMDYLKPGDYFFIQFAHNDQKLAHLKAAGGYRDNIIRYFEEIRSRKAYPVLVTPLGRNTWKGLEQTYNDLLSEYAEICRSLAAQYKVPLIDLHKASTDFIISHGLEDSRRWFYPGDYTHTNDFGAVLMARFVAEGCRQSASFSGYELLADSIVLWEPAFTPPAEIHAAVPPEGFTDDRPKQSGPAFPAQIDRPDEPATRADALSLLIQAVHFFPTNVYNDMYDDVVGHEWYAGTVECACQNGMIDPHLIYQSHFYPLHQITLEEFLSMAVNAYSSRKALTRSACDVGDLQKDGACWTDSYFSAAVSLGLVSRDAARKKGLTREEARSLARKISDLI